MANNKKPNKKEIMRRIRDIHERNMEEFGWYMQAVPAEEYDGIHANVHTHGIKESFGHLDFQVTFPVDARQSHAIVSSMVEEIKQGRVYEEGVPYDDILRGSFIVKFKKFREGERDVLRLLIPDSKNRQPDHPDCDPLFKTQLDDYPFDKQPCS